MKHLLYDSDWEELPKPISFHARSIDAGRIERMIAGSPALFRQPVMDWEEREPLRPVWQVVNREQDTAEAEREHQNAIKVVGVLATVAFLVALVALLPHLSPWLPVLWAR